MAPTDPTTPTTPPSFVDPPSTGTVPVPQDIANDAAEWHSYWRAVDHALAGQPSATRRQQYVSLCEQLRSPNGPFLGHPLFRLAILDLEAGDHTSAENRLNLAYEEDRRHRGPNVSRDMGAYRLRNLINDFFEWLSTNRAGPVGLAYASGDPKIVAVKTIGSVYDRSTLHPLESTGLTTQAFSRCLPPPSFHLEYALQSYRWAHHAIWRWHTDDQRPFSDLHRIAFARALCSTLGAGMEALLVGTIGNGGFSALLTAGRERGVWAANSSTEAALLLLYYFRNQIHPKVASRRPDFPPDRHTAHAMLICFERALLGFTP